MTQPNSRRPPDPLDQAAAALRATPIPAGPSADLVASTTLALQQANAAPQTGRPPSRRNLMVRIARFGSIPVAAALLLAVGIFFALPTKKAVAKVEVEVDGTTYHIQGPFTHQDLSVFLLCSSRQDGSDFLTLDEGLKAGLVTISEQEEERVGALRIENQSDRPLYLQEGERLVGGKRDRTNITT